MSPNSARVVAAAKRCLGCSFVHTGRDITTGLDCAGVVIYALTCAGVRVCPDHADGRQACWCRRYSRDIPAEDLRRALERLLLPVGRHEAQPGDVLLLTMQGIPRHLAIMSSLVPPRYIHARDRGAAGGSVVEEEFGRAQRFAVAAVYRVAEEGEFGQLMEDYTSQGGRLFYKPPEVAR